MYVTILVFISCLLRSNHANNVLPMDIALKDNESRSGVDFFGDCAQMFGGPLVGLAQVISGQRDVLIVYGKYKVESQIASIIHRFHLQFIPTVLWDVNYRSKITPHLSWLFSTLLFKSVILLCTFQESLEFIQNIQSTNQYFHDIYWITIDDQQRSNVIINHLTSLEYQEKIIVIKIDPNWTEPPDWCNFSCNFVAPVGYENITTEIVIGKWQNQTMIFDKRNADREWRNLRGRKLIATTVNRGETQGVTRNENGSLSGYGMIFDIIDMMSFHYNFAYETILSPDNFYGSKLDNGSWDGMIKQIIQKEAHMTAAVFQVTEERNNVVDLSISIFEEEMNILQRRPSESGNGAGLFRPFQTEVWILLFVTTLTMGLTTYLVTLIHIRFTRNSSENISFLSILECMWIIFRLLISQASKMTPTLTSGKVLFLFWGLFVLVVSSMYTANLIAFLTVPTFDILIKKLEDLSTKKDVIWLVKKSAAFISEIDSPVPTLYTYLKPDMERGRGRGISSDEEAAKLVLDKGYVYLQKGTTVDKIILDNLRSVGSCSYCIANEAFFKTPTSMAFPKGSYYRDLVDHFIERLQMHGISTHLYRRYYPTAEVCQLSDAIHGRPIKLTDCITIYFVLLGGMGAAILVFAFEKAKRTVGIFKRKKAIEESYNYMY